MLNSIAKTQHAQRWLDQFDLGDRPTAKLLLDSILVISNTELIENLTRTLEGFLNDTSKGKIALFVAREVKPHPYWQNNTRLSRLDGTSSIGSEGLFAHLIRDISKRNNMFLDHPSLDQMRQNKCRHILCIDDIIGSGKRITEFFNWLYANKTVKSWCSFGYVDMNVCAYAATLLGEKLLKDATCVKRVLIAHAIDRGRSFWTEEQKKQIKDMCEKYGKYTSRKKMSLGFKNSFTLILFSHKCPNTNPAILWAGSKKWSALFPARPELDLVDIFKNIKKDISAILKLIGVKLNISSLAWLSLRENEKEEIALLLKLTNVKYKPKVLSEMFNMSMPEVNMHIAAMKRLKWIGDDCKVTKYGKRMLQLARKRQIVKDEVAEKEDFYYPVSLRAPVD